MTGKLTFALTHAQARQNAAQAVMQAPDGYFVALKPATRSLEANARMWAMLTDVSRQVVCNYACASELSKNICEKIKAKAQAEDRKATRIARPTKSYKSMS